MKTWADIAEYMSTTPAFEQAKTGNVQAEQLINMYRLCVFVVSKNYKDKELNDLAVKTMSEYIEIYKKESSL